MPDTIYSKKSASTWKIGVLFGLFGLQFGLSCLVNDRKTAQLQYKMSTFTLSFTLCPLVLLNLSAHPPNSNLLCVIISQLPSHPVNREPLQCSSAKENGPVPD